MYYRCQPQPKRMMAFSKLSQRLYTSPGPATAVLEIFSGVFLPISHIWTNVTALHCSTASPRIQGLWTWAWHTRPRNQAIAKSTQAMTIHSCRTRGR
jgi:hypothetical protein